LKTKTRLAILSSWMSLNEGNSQTLSMMEVFLPRNIATNLILQVFGSTLVTRGGIFMSWKALTFLSLLCGVVSVAHGQEQILRFRNVQSVRVMGSEVNVTLGGIPGAQETLVKVTSPMNPKLVE